MADTKISAFNAATTVTSTDVVPIVQNGGNYKLSMQTMFSNIPVMIVSTQASESPAAGTSTTPTALSTSIKDSLVTSASGVGYYSLAAGTQGLRKLIIASGLGASATASVAVTGGLGVANITFNANNQLVELENVNASWYVKHFTSGVTIA